MGLTVKKSDFTGKTKTIFFGDDKLLNACSDVAIVKYAEDQFDCIDFSYLSDEYRDILYNILIKESDRLRRNSDLSKAMNLDNLRNSL